MVRDPKEVGNPTLPNSLCLVQQLVEMVVQRPGSAPGDPGVRNIVLDKEDGVISDNRLEQAWNVNVGIAA